MSDVTRGTASIQVMVQFASEQGLQTDQCLSGSNISAAQLADPKAEIVLAQELAVARNLLRELGHIPGLGLLVGQRVHIGMLGVWGYFVASCRSYRDAAARAKSNLELSSAVVHSQLEKRGSRFALKIDSSEVDADVAQFFLERDFASFITITDEVRPGGLPLTGVDFTFQPPAYADEFEKICRVRPHFGCKEDLIWIDSEALDLPLAQGDPLLTRMFMQQCQQLLEKRSRRDGLAGRVRDVLLQHSESFPGVDEVADLLFMSPRSLRRKLQEEGTAFRKIKDEIHELLAEELLTSTDMKLYEVADRLGYSEPSSFIYAFTRWKGISPSTFRQQQKAGCIPSDS